jgi:hypothetical protein
MTGVLDELKANRAKREESAASAFAKLVREIVSGDAVRPDAAQRVLDAAGRTPEDLDRAIGEARQRAELRARVQRGRDAAQRKMDLQQQFAALSAEYERIEEAHRQKAGPLVAQLRGLEAVERDAAQARDAILSAALPDTPAGRELAAARQRLNELTMQAKPLRDRVELADLGLDQASNAEKYGAVSDPERKAAAEKRLAAARAARDENNLAIQAARQEVERLERALCGDDAKPGEDVLLNS